MKGMLKEAPLKLKADVNPKNWNYAKKMVMTTFRNEIYSRSKELRLNPVTEGRLAQEILMELTEEYR